AAMGMAMIYNRTKQPEKALKILQEVWKRIARSRMKKSVAPKAAVLAQIGLARQQMGQIMEALQYFRKANAMQPSTELTERIRKLENIIEKPHTIEQLLIRATQLQR